MPSIQKVIFPGIAAGCLFLVLVVSIIANPTVALAAGSGQPAAVRTHSGTVGLANVHAGVQAIVPAAKSNTASLAKVEQAKPASQIGGCSLNQGYPDSVRQWCSLIERYAAEHQLDPNLIAAVMLQESGGNPRAYSKSGAVGLLQVMPNDGLAAGFNCINGPCFSSRPSTAELYDPEFNISYGANMLAELIQKYGDVREALHAYGPIGIGYGYADIILNIMNRYH